VQYTSDGPDMVSTG